MKPGAVAISARDVGLSYSIRTEDSGTLKRAFLGLVKRQYRHETFWALKNLGFEIPVGESFGILGLNGSGKSTLLKLITGILRPDVGQLTVDGRVSALLELGAGFQPDLTGRENIFLNGSLLGLSMATIRARMDEIIDFSGIRPFIDTPVKHYSSGMYMRLGFSIAINVDPEILLIDEIFAVGDLNFQEKCMNRIEDFKAAKKTLVLVSHDLNALRSLCTSAIWLHKGELMKTGHIDEVIDFYKNYLLSDKDDEQQQLRREDGQNRWGTGKIKITDVIMLNSGGGITRNFTSGERMTIRIHYHSDQRVEKPVFGIAIHRHDGTHVCGPNMKQSGYSIDAVCGDGWLDFTIPGLPLLPSQYLLSAVIYDDTCVIPYDHLDRMFPFTIVEGSSRETFGLIAVNGEWSAGDQGRNTCHE